MPEDEELDDVEIDEQTGEIIKPVSYESLVTEEPMRPVDLVALGAKTLGEAEEESASKTDIKAILDILTPKFPDDELNKVLQPAMVSRIPSDNLLDKMKLLCLRELQRRDPSQPVDFISIISWVHDALFIGWDGRGIADRLELAGVLHEEELEKLSKQVGLGG